MTDILKREGGRVSELLAMDMEEVYAEADDPDDISGIMTELQNYLGLAIREMTRLNNLTDPGMQWILVVEWDSPDRGVDVRGPFPSNTAARRAWDESISNDFLNEGELPDDVAYHVRRVTR